jgi:hypothetical protein
MFTSCKKVQQARRETLSEVFPQRIMGVKLGGCNAEVQIIACCFMPNRRAGDASDSDEI